MTEFTANPPPASITRETLCEALRVLGLDPDNVTQVHIDPRTMTVHWDEQQVNPKYADRWITHLSVVDIEP